MGRGNAIVKRNGGVLCFALAIGRQLHAGTPMRVEFRNIRLKVAQ